MTTFDGAYGNEATKHIATLKDQRTRAELETAVIQRHGHIAKIENISDDGLRQMLEEEPRR